jgi:putative tryptophan/tyrosine transport system substrate-binding protein
MRRREFIAGFGGAAIMPLAAAIPLAARAQQAMRVLGFLHSSSPGGFGAQLTALRQALKEGGFEEGRNIAIEFRWAEDRYERLPGLAAELVALRVAVIFAAGGNISAVAAKAATSTIPIVFPAVADPVSGGLVASLNRPGGNATGVSAFSAELDAKRMELLRELLPNVRLVGALLNPNRPNPAIQLRDVQAAAQAVGLPLIALNVANAADIDTAFASLVEQRAGALLVTADPFLTQRSGQIAVLAARHAIPTVYPWRDFIPSGGLMSYSTSLADAYRQAGLYVVRILKGEKPADLPVLQPTKFQLVINLNTARTLGLTVPPSLLARADEVIE